MSLPRVDPHEGWIQINWAKLAVAAGIFLELVSPALQGLAPAGLQSLIAAVGAALIVAGMYEGAPAPHQSQ